MRRETFLPSADMIPAGASKGFNLSRWAIDHGGFTAFLLVLLLAAGAFSFLRIGQKEDPDFTFRVMVVQVLWPGATVEEMQDQVVDRVERKLQETPGLDFVRSYTRSGFANIFVNLKGSMRGDAVKEAFYQARKKIGDIRQMLPEGGLSALDIEAALGGQNAMDPAGRIETRERSVRIDVEGGLRSLEDIRELRLRAGQQTFRLGDIAEVRRGLEDPPSAKTYYQGREAVLLGTTMETGATGTEVRAPGD